MKRQGLIASKIPAANPKSKIQNLKSTPPRQAEFESKLARIREYLRQRELGGVALGSQALFAWASAGGENYVSQASERGVAHLVVTPERVMVLTNNIEMQRLHAEEFKGIDTQGMEFWACPWHAEDLAAEIGRRMHGNAWACDLGLPGSQKLDEAFQALTYALTPSEVARYRKLGQDCSEAMEEALSDIRPGCTEQAVAGAICRRLWEHGVRPHVILVAADERVYGFRHPIPTGKKFRTHLMAVLCGKRGGLIVNLTRMLHRGRKLPDELRRKHEACCAIDAALNGATRPGLPLNEVFAAGVAEYARQGFKDEWKLHHQGGPTGYHGRSFLGTPAETRRVCENQAFAWNPSITGTKSEDTMVAGREGFEFLSSPTGKWPALTVQCGGRKLRRAAIRLL